MLELTSAQFRFRRAVPEGDLYEALGLSPNAKSLDVDVAGARLAEQMPTMAQEVSSVVNVLAHRQRKTLYDTVRKVRDEAADFLDARYGSEFCSSIPNLRRELWDRSCRLFRFDLANDEQKLGEKGRQELAAVGPSWIVYDFLDVQLNRLNFTVQERNAGNARRDAWHAKCHCRDAKRLFFIPRVRATTEQGGEAKPPENFKLTDYVYWQATCPRCRQKYQPTEFDDRYDFEINDKLNRGELIRGEAVWGSSPIFAIVGSPSGRSAPKDVLDRFFGLQNTGKDVTFEETEEDLRKRPVIAKSLGTPQPASSGKAPLWMVLIAISILSAIFRTVSHDNSAHWQNPQPSWPHDYDFKPPIATPKPPTPPTQWTPRDSAAPTVPGLLTDRELEYLIRRSSASPPRSTGNPHTRD
jgi:hypothetical protein